MINNLTHFQDAMDVVHISKGDQDIVFAMLAAVLWLGNISFAVIDNENHVEVVEDEGRSSITFVFNLKCLSSLS